LTGWRSERLVFHSVVHISRVFWAKAREQQQPGWQAFEVLFDEGLITSNETAKTVQKDYPRFRLYSSRKLNSALNNEHKRMEKDVDTQKMRARLVSVCLI